MTPATTRAVYHRDDLRRLINPEIVAIVGASETRGSFGERTLSNMSGFTGKVYAIDANGNPTLLADIGYTAEHVIFVPPMGGAYYQAELSFERPRENRLWCATPSQ